ncbi:MAG: hypothetical protein HRU13_02415 [Phycisphaerales bacterium]|nr:hypothetical protein [Phycisphaerales bacterium]
MAIPPELDLIEVLCGEDEPLWYAAVQLGSIETAQPVVASLLKHGYIELFREGEPTVHWQWREILADDPSWAPVQPKESSTLWLRITEQGFERYQREWNF